MEATLTPININFEELDRKIDEELKKELNTLHDLEVEKEEIGDPKKLVDSISQIVWQQLILQLAGTAGKEFVEQNNDLNLSLKKADHILSSDKFVKGEMPSHNFANAEKYQNRYEKWDANFTDSSHEKFIKEYRQPFDANRPHGAGCMAKDHTIPVAEMLRDPKIATFMSEEEKVRFANDQNFNLKDLDREANISKSDRTMRDWLNSTRNGKHPDERFNINKEELLERDDKAREELNRRKTIAEKEAIKEGHISMVDEAKRSLTITTQAIAVALLAKLTRHIFQEVILWLMKKDRKTHDLIEAIKKGFADFIFDFKNNVLLGIDVGVTVILTQIFGEIIPTIRKALLFFVIGGKTIWQVRKYLNNPENVNKDSSVKMLEIGKIVTIGLTTAGGIALGTTITYLLLKYVPVTAVQIPLLGSAAGLIGIFTGGIIAGVCGAIILHKIDGTLEGKKLSENAIKQLESRNNVLVLQDKQFNLYMNEVDVASNKSLSNIYSDLRAALDEMERMRESLKEERKTENEDNVLGINNMIDSVEW